MLPLTSHKSFQIPHSLATVAAIAALITALGWEASSHDGDRIEASPAVATRLGAASGQAEQAQQEPAAEEKAARGDGGNCTRGCDRNSLSELLPLVLPSLSGP